ARSRKEYIRATRAYLDMRAALDPSTLPRPASVTPALWRIVGNCLASDPADRYLHALQIRDALESNLHGPLSRLSPFRDSARATADRVTGVMRIIRDSPTAPVPGWRKVTMTLAFVGIGVAAALGVLAMLSALQ
ncbi:MAG: hypothetical protein ACI9WU_002903, partial [Myxococcota bacterium]